MWEAAALEPAWLHAHAAGRQIRVWIYGESTEYHYEHISLFPDIWQLRMAGHLEKTSRWGDPGEPCYLRASATWVAVR